MIPCKNSPPNVLGLVKAAAIARSWCVELPSLCAMLCAGARIMEEKGMALRHS